MDPLYNQSVNYPEAALAFALLVLLCWLRNRIAR